MWIRMQGQQLFEADKSVDDFSLVFYLTFTHNTKNNDELLVNHRILT